MLKVFKKKDQGDIIHYVVLIEAPLEVVGAELAHWFDNEWRASGSAIRYQCADKGALKVGSWCAAEFKKILPARWELAVAKYEANHFVQASLSGFFNGTETVTVEERDNGIKVDYRMTYEFKNPLHQIMWSLWMDEAFIKEVRNAMDALKTYCQKAK